MKLSPASKITLLHQGGVMSDEEATRSGQDPLHTLYIKIWERDDTGATSRNELAKQVSVHIVDSLTEISAILPTFLQTYA